MFDNATFYALYAVHAVTHNAKRAAVNTKEYIADHKTEIAVVAGTSAVVGIAARVDGFKAGYEFAQNQK